MLSQWISAMSRYLQEKAAQISVPDGHKTMQHRIRSEELGIDMEKFLRDLMGEAGCVEYEGEMAYGIYRRSPSPVQISGRFLRSDRKPVQGLAFSAKGGEFVWQGGHSPSVRIWTDTAPRQFSLNFKPKPRAKETKLHIWNVWQVDPKDGGEPIEWAWYMNSGMRIRPIEGTEKIVFHCSHGAGDVNFESMVVELDFG